MVALSIVTSKGQTIVPPEVMEALKASETDRLIWYATKSGQFVCEVLAMDDPGNDFDLAMIEASCQEWLSPKDDEAFRYLQHL